MSENQESRVVRRRHPLGGLDPWTHWEPLRSVMDEFFADRPQDWRNTAVALPSVDITESDDAYRVRAELPGVDKDDVTVEIHDHVLSIRGEKKTRRDEKLERGRRLECSYGAFSRSFSLPQDADDEKISADFRDGVLEVAVSKRAEGKPKQIAVKS